MQLDKIPQDFNVFSMDMLRFCPSCLATKVCKVRSKNTVSIVHVLHSDRAVGQ
jgi:hypothetical protein